MNTNMSNPVPECTISSDAETSPCIFSSSGESEDDLSHDDTYDCPSVNEFDFDNSSDIASITTKHADNDLKQNTPTSSCRMFIKIQASERNHYVFIDDMDQLATLIEKLDDKHGINMEDHHLTFDQKPLLDSTKTLQEYHIKNYDTLILKSQQEMYDDPEDDSSSLNSTDYSDSVLITVLDQKDLPYLLQVMKTDQIATLKKRINSKLGISLEKCSLKFNGHPLNFGKTLKEYKIEAWDTIAITHTKV